MKILNLDLDNTLIFSNKHNIGNKKRCVEIYKGKEAAFITEYTAKLLEQVRNTVLLVPTTTRTMEQYHRIDLGFLPEYALVCNGGVLLRNGQEEKTWYQKSMELIADCQIELFKAEDILKQDPDRNREFEARNIRNLFVYTKSMQPSLTVNRLKMQLDNSLVDVFYNIQKVYIVPKKLNKGTAVRRLKERLCADYVIAAGDNEFDISMFHEADIAFAPKELKQKKLPKNTIIMNTEMVFSEFILEYVLTMVNS